MNVTPAYITQCNAQLEHRDALDVIRWAYDTYGDGLVYACSFGAEAIVLIDLIAVVRPDAQLIFLDTHVHFPQTYALIEKVKEKYPQLRIEMVQPTLTLAQQAAQYGEKLWETNPNQCCELRKVLPMKKALAGAQAWMTGLRRQQSSTRAHTNYVNWDAKFEKIKICPLIHWTWDDIWAYISAHALPYHALHDEGYPSIGCMPCTAPATEAGDSRSGRWSGHGKTECGLHQN